MELIRLEGLSFRYPGTSKFLLRDISLSIQRGDRILIHGPSGSGKSTLLAIMAGLVPDHVGGELTGKCRLSYTRRALVLQNPEAQVITPTVEEELAFPLENQGEALPAMQNKISTILDRFGMAALRSRPPLELSGGECQRLSLAAAMIQDPDILFLDEPTSYLDEDRALQLLQDLDKLPPEVTVVMVEHRLELVEHFCTRWVRIDGDRLLEQQTLAEVRATTASLEIPEERFSKHTTIVALPFVAGYPGAAAASTAIDAPASAPETKSLAVPLLRIHNLSHRYPCTPEPVFDRLSLTIPSFSKTQLVLPVQTHVKTTYKQTGQRQGTIPHQVGGSSVICGSEHQSPAGSITAIVGPSGCGKTTLLKKILKLLPTESNTIFLLGRDITTIPNKDYYSYLAYIPQNPEHLFLEETVAAELERGTGNPQQALDLARVFRLDHRLKFHPFKLSEGEKRRLSLCIALAMHRPLIIMDEPTYGLDRESRRTLIDYLSMLRASGSSCILVSHDTPFIQALDCQVYRISGGLVQPVDNQTQEAQS
ncbi:MAG: ATP-binding cassette domain-containing protein [Termitinemataceae bacterium]